jgi:hypothetical protein
MDKGGKKTPEEVAEEIFGNWIVDSTDDEEEQGED